MKQQLIRTLAVPLALAFAAASCASDDAAAPSTSDIESDDVAPSETDADAVDTSAPLVAPGEVDTPVVAETDTPVYGGSLTMAVEGESVGLRPWEDSCVSACVNVSRTIYDVLIEQNAEGDYEGYLAESIEPNDDFTVWTMTLRRGVRFHNEVAVSAQTIVDMFAIQRAGAISAGQIAGAGIVGVEAVDDLTVRYLLEAPNSAFSAVLNTAAMGFVFEPAAAAADPGGFSASPIGTGPFVLESRDIDNETVVVRNDNYWRIDDDGNQLPYLDSVAFRPIPDEGTRLDALISGTVNLMETRRQATIRDAREIPGLALYEFQGNTTGGGMFNTSIPPFDDVRIRLGLNKLNDTERAIEAVGGAGISLPATQWFSADSPWWTQQAADSYPTFDFEAGTALIQEYVDDPARSDGKAPGEQVDVTISCPADPTLIAVVQVIEQVWTGSGLVNVTLASSDLPTHVSAAANSEHQAHCWRWAAEGDPSVQINPFLADPATSVQNFPNWFDPEAVAWADEATLTDDFETRKELYSKIMVRINEQAPVWYGGGTATLIATDEEVRGVNSWTLPDGTLGNGTPGAITYLTQVFVSE